MKYLICFFLEWYKVFEVCHIHHFFDALAVILLTCKNFFGDIRKNLDGNRLYEKMNLSKAIWIGCIEKKVYNLFFCNRVGHFVGPSFLFFCSRSKRTVANRFSEYYFTCHTKLIWVQSSLLNETSNLAMKHKGKNSVSYKRQLTKILARNESTQ